MNLNIKKEDSLQTSLGKKRYQIRVPQDLDAWLEKKAKENCRSKNAQLNHLLLECKIRDDIKNNEV